MKIALGQLKICWEDKAANMEKLKVCLKELSGVDLLLLPEMRKRLYVRSGNWQDSMI